MIQAVLSTSTKKTKIFVVENTSFRIKLSLTNKTFEHHFYK